MSLCPVCGNEEGPRANFCSSCGASLAGPPAIEGERRQLTVLFCDLVGSTELSTRLDPEEFGDLIRTYHRRAVEVIRGYGGDLEAYLGDGIVARFGWPQAHDDDAERAVRAALEIVDEIAEINEGHPEDRRIAVRIGAHTGTAVIGELGPTAEQPETMAFGETLNLASRLQSEAAPDSVVISSFTLQLVPGIFVVEDLGVRELKGIGAPIAAYRVVQPSGVRSRLDAARDSLTPLVNRTAELDLLVNRWRAAQSQGGQAVMITGEPGVGKSRLVYELRRRIGDVPHSWLECTCSSYTQQSAFLPAIQLVEQGLQIGADDDPGERLEKLRGGLEAAGLATDEAVPLLANLLSIAVPESAAALAMSPERRRRRTIDVLVDWVLALARLQPMILLVEDLHWCDPSTLEVCGELIARGRGCSLMLLGTARPEFTPPWRARAWLTTLSVGPLADDEIRAMIAALGDGRTLPDPVLDRVVGEADGIPLYAEEVGRTALEAGLAGEGDGSAVGIPTTLQGSLMARLDRLSAAKRVAQQAAVIGREFSYELLFEVAGLEDSVLRGGLDRLVETELVFQHGAPPRATYTFKHALIQDAAYQSLLKRTRRELHRRIAQALEARLDDEGKASPEAVARHYEAAEETAAAVANYRRAADLAAHQSAFFEAIAHYRRAIALLAELPAGPARDEEEVDVQLGLGSSIIATRSYADPEIATAYERARELCEGLGDDAKVASALAGLSIYYLNRGRLDVGTELAERVLEVGDALGDDALQLLGHVQLALPFICRAAFADAQEHARAAIEIYSPERHHPIAFRFGTDQGVAARCFEGWSLFGLGRLDRATDSMRSAVELARRLGHPFSTAYALLFETTMHWVRGDAEAQRESSQAVLAIAEEQGFEYWTGLGHVFLGNELALRTGDPAALPPIINGSMVAGATGNVLCSTPVLASVAEAQAAAGELNDAMGTLDGALAISDQTGQPWWDAELHRLKADMLLAAAGDEPDAATVGRAERRLEKALEIARKQDFPVHELRAATAQGRLLAARGEAERAIALVRPLYEAFDEGFAAAPLARARELLQELGVAVPPHSGGDGGAPGQPSSKPSVA